MSSPVLWLAATLVFASFTFLANGAPLQVMSAPNLLRVGATENIFVECQDCTGADIPVRITVMNHPTKNRELASASVTLTSANNFQALAQVKIPVAGFSKDPNVKQYVNLQARFPDRLLEKVVLVSFQSGYIFIQTDKSLYTPGSTVLYRMFAVTPSMRPVNEAPADSSVAIEIVTPDGNTLSQGTVSVKSGLKSGNYKLGEIVSPGVWKMVAKFDNNPQQSYSAEFEVKEYVLPSFEVKLTPLSRFFYVDSKELIVNIKATYLFGQEVNGIAYVVFGVIQDGEKKSFPASLQKKRIESGNGVATLNREHITQTFNDINKLVKSSIYVAVSVLTESGSEMVEAELRNIQIVTSPYTIHFKKTPKYFKPGMSYDVAVEVVNPDDTPAQGVTVVVDPGQVQGRTATNGMARLTINTAAGTNRLTITATTSDQRISRDRQATATMEALPHVTSGNNFIHISVDTAEVPVGENLKMNFMLNSNANNEITYLILSRGQLVKSGRYRTRGQVLISMMETITKDMLPSFRIIAYYHTDDNKVVSDSVWVDVKDSCMGSLKLEPIRLVNSYEPRKMFGLKITGDPEATVGLVAVDKGVYVLNNKHRLTQKKVWDIVEKTDTGCTAGGGRDAMHVFYDAGLLFESSTASGTPHRTELKCQSSSRRKRTTTIMEVTTSLLSNFTDKIQRECCSDGMKATPVSYSCERRSEYIEDGAACREAFLHCCMEMERQLADKREENLQLARSEEDDSYMDSNEIVSRTKFPESWLWSDIELPSCPEQTPNCDTMTFEKPNIPLPDSITTWQVTGISLSSTHGICVAEPLEVIVRKEFFIDLRLPYSAVRGEQIEIKAILHNYTPDLATVRVDLIEEPDVCSVASKRGRYRQEVKLGAQTTRAVPFVIIPMKEGQRTIEVKAAVRDSYLTDGISKKLRVVPQGVLVTMSKTVAIDPANKGVGGTQQEIINSRIPRRDVAPRTPTSTQVFLTGREQVSSLVENAIGGKSMGSLIYKPWGCGEQNLAHMTLPVIATTYLDKTNHWEAVGFEKRDEALQHIRTGYETQLTYRNDDGSFSVFRGSKSSTWLTAYVVKVFAMANSLVAVPNSIICDAVKFLINKKQQQNGVFTEDGYAYDTAMRGGVEGRDYDASMTAFCLIAIQESSTLCAPTVSGLQGSINRAVAYLESRLPRLTYAYAVAITSYALANEKKLNRETLYRFASPDRSHWPVSRSRMNTLEATAYALLALLKVEAFEDAKPVVRWFNQQQMPGGGYGSTQVTIMVYQAVAEYWSTAKEPDYDLNVDIVLPTKSNPVKVKYNFNRDNHYTTRTSKINDINQNVTVTATGTGEATLKMVSLYYALPKEKDSGCEKFNMSVQLIEDKISEEEKIYKLKIEVLYKDKMRDAGMSILDVGLLTGFSADKNDLDALSKGRAQIIKKYEMNKVLSEKGSLIIYLDKVSHTRPDEITFRVRQEMKVGVLQPAPVSVYEYYDQAHCVKFYHPERRAGQLLRLCRNHECRCAEENCSMQKKGDISNDERITKACESTESHKIDFVYKVTLDTFRGGLSTDIYDMRVQEVIKEGSAHVGPLNSKIAFLSYQHCREVLDLKAGKTYLIMGTSKDIDKDDQTQLYEYILGENTWIEYWPTKAECQTDKYRHTCLGLEELVDVHTVFGCDQ